MLQFKNIFSAVFIILLVIIFQKATGQIKNAKTISVKIEGNCDMCKANIEKAGNIKKVAKVNWNTETKMAKISYDSINSVLDLILKRIALVGYDNEQYLAPDEAYAKLSACCQYERHHQSVISSEKKEKQLTQSETKPLKSVYDIYFKLTETLINSNEKEAVERAKQMLESIKNVDMAKLGTEEHQVWMKVMTSLTKNSEQLVSAKKIDAQRIIFLSFSKDIYELLKVSKLEVPVFYQNCPMYNDGKGATWLSKESAIRNPYYGSQMLTCGKTIDTIK